MRISELLITRPGRIARGDTVGVVAPAWSFDPVKFKAGVKLLKGLGFKVKYDRAIFSKYWSMAGHDEQRAGQINRMFADKAVKAIFCAKAGYGSIRTIPYLNRKVIAGNPKIFVGYSDITILLAYLQRIANIVVFHGPVVSSEMHRDMSNLTLEYLVRSLMEPFPLGAVSFPGMKTIRSGRATGRLVGGNLSMLMSAIGTPYDIDTDFKILFIEDVGEDMETIDNFLLHLKLAGKFRRIRGIVFGRMVDCRDDSGRKYKIRDIVNDTLGDLSIPVVYGFPSGHARGRGANVTVPLGVSVTLDTGKPSLIFNEAGVK